MTEAKSPREIAEELAALIGRLERDEPSYITTKAEDETIAFLKRNGRSLLSYAAERERLLADADAAVSEAHEWLSQRGQIGVSPGSRWERILSRHHARLRSRPATEGKREDE